VAVHILAVALGLMFLTAGVRKLFTDWVWGRTRYQKYHPLWVYYASGVIELVCGLGLFVPGLRFFSAIIILVMIGLVSAHPWRGDDYKQIIVPAVVSTSLLILLAWLTRPHFF